MTKLHTHPTSYFPKINYIHHCSNFPTLRLATCSQFRAESNSRDDDSQSSRFTLLNRPIITLQVDPKIDFQIPIPRLEFQLKRAFFYRRRVRRIFEPNPPPPPSPPFRSRDTSRGHCVRLCYAKPLCAINTGEHPPVLVTAAVYDGRSFPFRRPPWKRRTPLKL